MRRRLQRGKYFLLLAVAAGWVACRDTVSTPAGPPFEPDAALHQVRWSSSVPRFAVRAKSGSTPVAGAPAASTDGSFWAFVDKDASLTLSVLAPDGTWQPFASIVVPRGALLRRPDGRFFSPHDSIQITLTPDSTNLGVDLAPSGLVFNPLNPARVTLSYQLADPDLNADGKVNATDDYIRQVLLGLSRRDNDLDPWSAFPSLNDVVNQRVSADIGHFTGYAVSW